VDTKNVAALRAQKGNSMADRPTEAISKWAFELNGLNAGLITSFEGLDIKAEKNETKPGGDFYTRKSIGKITPAEGTLKLASTQSQPLQDWVDATLNADWAYKDGRVIQANMKNKNVREASFVRALITSIAFPKCEGGSKDMGFVTLKFQPTEVTWKAGDMSAISVGNEGGLNIKKMTEGAFKLQIDGMDCTRVSKLDAIEIKQVVEFDKIGPSRVSEIAPCSIEFPDLKLTLSEATAQSWYDWHEDFVIKGNCGQGKEKGGSLELLAQDMKTVLSTVTFEQLGIYELKTDKAESGAKSLKRINITAYCEAMKVKLQVTD
jgi:hypothetical protein